MVATLKISNGTDWVSLIETGKSGFHLMDWTPQSAEPKGGGEYQDSPMAHGKRLINKKFDNVMETFELKLNGNSTDTMIAEAQKLRRLLEQASDFWQTNWCDDPVWIECKAHKESNTRYAVIHQGRLVSDDNPFAPPFLQGDCSAVMDELELVVERGPWLANAPGESECLTISGSQSWQVEGDWVENDTSPTGLVIDIIQAANGDIFASDGGQVHISTDNGSSWAVSTTDPTGTIYKLFQASNGYLYIGDYEYIWRSVDGGANWTSELNVASSYFYDFTENSYISKLYACCSNGKVYSSTDNGDNWAEDFAIPAPYYPAYSALHTSNGYTIIGGNNCYYRRSPTGALAGMFRFNDFVGSMRGIVEADDGYLYACGTSGFYRSIDNAVSWQKISDTHGTRFIQITSGFYEHRFYMTNWITASSGIYFSDNYGITWSQGQSGTTFYNICKAADGSLYVGINGAIYKKSAGTDITIGIDDSCGAVPVVNKRQHSNITHIFVDDGGSFSGNQLPATLPLTLYPAVPADEDKIYFGSSTSYLNASPFSSLLFDIDQIASATTSYTIIWEYYDTDTNWKTIPSLQDNTSSFSIAGVNAVVWVPPSTWATVAINGVTAYWVRARIDTLAGTMTPPTQQNQDIFAITWPYISISADDIGGDIASNAIIRLINTGDKDGPAGNAPNLYDNKIICGLRSLARGENFNAFLNASDTQAPFGVTCATVTARTSFVANTLAPTGRNAKYDSDAAVSTMTSRLTWTFDTTVARDYYGTYHSFIRYKQTGGTAGDVSFRLMITTGSGGISTYTPTVTPSTTNDWQLADMGRITLPISGLVRHSEIPDITVITLQCTALDADPDLHIYDLILIPTDEWVGEFIDTVNSADSTVEQGKLLEIDSLSNLKHDAIAKVRTNDGNLSISSIWQPNVNGPAILQSRADQRLWILCAQTAAAASTEWVSYPDSCHMVRVYKNEKYLGMRGNE